METRQEVVHKTCKATWISFLSPSSSQRGLGISRSHWLLLLPLMLCGEERGGAQAMLCVSMVRSSIDHHSSGVNTQVCPHSKLLANGGSQRRGAANIVGGGPQKRGLWADLCNIIAGEHTMFICIFFNCL